MAIDLKQIWHESGEKLFPVLGEMMTKKQLIPFDLSLQNPDFSQLDIRSFEGLDSYATRRGRAKRGFRLAVTASIGRFMTRVCISIILKKYGIFTWALTFGRRLGRQFSHRFRVGCIRLGSTIRVWIMVRRLLQNINCWTPNFIYFLDIYRYNLWKICQKMRRYWGVVFWQRWATLPKMVVGRRICIFKLY